MLMTVRARKANQTSSQGLRRLRSERLAGNSSHGELEAESKPGAEPNLSDLRVLGHVFIFDGSKHQLSFLNPRLVNFATVSTMRFMHSNTHQLTPVESPPPVATLS